MGPMVQKYPFVTADEWRAACTSFALACEGPVAAQHGWTAILRQKQNDVELLRIVRRIVRATDGSADGEKRRAAAICRETFSTTCGGADAEFEEQDEEALPLHRAGDREREAGLVVTYDVVLSPSYSVPVLYFSVDDSTGGPVMDLASIHADIVPVDFRHQVLGVGVIGAISMTDHPATGVPSFFIHPCNTADAMRHVGADRPVPVSEYVFLWMGIIAGCVGLYAPAMSVFQKEYEKSH